MLHSGAYFGLNDGRFFCFLTLNRGEEGGGDRLRHYPNIKSTLGQRLVFAGMLEMKTILHDS